MPEAYRGVKEDWRRSLAALGVRGGLKILEWRPGRGSAILGFCDEREGEREGEKDIVLVGRGVCFGCNDVQ